MPPQGFGVFFSTSSLIRRDKGGCNTLLRAPAHTPDVPLSQRSLQPCICRKCPPLHFTNTYLIKVSVDLINALKVLLYYRNSENQI